MKKLYIFFCILFFNNSCIDFANKELELVKSKSLFNEIFQFEDSVILRPYNIDIPISFTITKKGEFLLCDYNRKKVQLLDSDGIFIKDILSGTISGKLFGSPICIAENTDEKKFYIADNSNRRIFILDSLFNYESSFIVSGSHMTPIYMQSHKNKLFMSGHNINNEKFVHLYSTEGYYQSSIYETISLHKNNNIVNGAGNYIHFDFCNNNIFIIELMNYGLTKIDTSNLKKKKSINFKSNYFISLNKKILEKRDKDIADFQNSFSKPTFIKCINEKVFIFSEQPSIDYFGDYFNTRRYILEIFNSSLNPIFCNIDVGNYIPIGYSEHKKAFAFITNHDKKNNLFTIKFYGMNTF